MQLLKCSIFSIFFFLLHNIAIAQTTVTVTWTEKTKLPETETIYYKPSQKLTWKDFLGTPPPPSSIAAITSSGFGYSASMKRVNDKVDIKILVYCFFNKPKSWVRVKNKTVYILEHEQHHFDATYLATVEFIQKIKAAYITDKNMNAVVGKLYNEANIAMQTLQDNYDKETSNGLKKDKQAEWNLFFNNKLAPIIN